MPVPDYPVLMIGGPDGLLMQHLDKAADPSRIVPDAVVTFGDEDDYDKATVVSLEPTPSGRVMVYFREIEDEPPAEAPFVQDGPSLFD